MRGYAKILDHPYPTGGAVVRDLAHIISIILLEIMYYVLMQVIFKFKCFWNL